MTATEAKVIARITGSIVLALAAPIIMALMVGAWKGKETTEDHNADVAAIQSKLQRILDVVCQDKPAARACE